MLEALFFPLIFFKLFKSKIALFFENLNIFFLESSQIIGAEKKPLK